MSKIYVVWGKSTFFFFFTQNHPEPDTIYSAHQTYLSGEHYK